MTGDLLKLLQEEILPAHYPIDLSDEVEDGCLLFRRGVYVCLAMPFSGVPDGDFGSKKAKSTVRATMTCIPFLRERGLFVIYYGDAAEWRDSAAKFTVDKTALRPVILQSVHFIDPNTGENVNTRTQWGPLKFGPYERLILEIEGVAWSIEQAPPIQPN